MKRVWIIIEYCYKIEVSFWFFLNLEILDNVFVVIVFIVVCLVIFVKLLIEVDGFFVEFVLCFWFFWGFYFFWIDV